MKLFKCEFVLSLCLSEREKVNIPVVETRSSALELPSIKYRVCK